MLKTQGLQSPEQVRGFLEGARPLGFQAPARAAAYDWIAGELRRLHYPAWARRTRAWCSAIWPRSPVAHERDELRPWTPPPAGQRALRSLLKRRAKLVQVQTTLEQSFAGEKEIAAAFARAKEELEHLTRVIERRIKALGREYGWCAHYRRCCSIFGVGETTAAARRDLKPYYERLRARGVQATQAHVALARKLPRIAFSLMKNHTIYDQAKIPVPS